MFLEFRLIHFTPPTPPVPPVSPSSTPRTIDSLPTSFVNLDVLQEASVGDRLVQSVMGQLSSGVIILNPTYLPVQAKDLSHKKLAYLLKDALTQLGLQASDEEIAAVQGDALSNFLQYVLQKHYGEIMTDLPPTFPRSISLTDLQNWAIRKNNYEVDISNNIKINLMAPPYNSADFDLVQFFDGIVTYTETRRLDRSNYVYTYISGDQGYRDAVQALGREQIEAIKAQKQFKYLHSDLVDNTAIELADPNKRLKRFHERVSLSESNNTPTNTNITELRRYLNSQIDGDHFKPLNTQEIERFESELSSDSNSDGLKAIASQVFDYTNFNNGVSKILFENYLDNAQAEDAKSFLLALIQKMPKHPHTLARVSVEINNTPIGLHTQKIIQLAEEKILVSGYDLYELLSYSNTRQNPIIKNPSVRQRAFSQLIRHVYKDSPFGQSLKTMVERAGNSTDLSNPYVSQIAKYLQNVEHQLAVYNTYNRPGVLDLPLAGLDTLLRMVDTMSENNLLVTSASIMATTNLLLKSEAMGKAISVLAVMGAVPLLLKDDSKTQIMLAYHQKSLSSVINDRFYTETGITDDEKKYFPYLIKNLLLNNDFTTKSWGDFMDFINGTNQNFISGESPLAQMLRGSGRSDDMYKGILSIMKKLHPRIASQNSNITRDTNLLEVLLVWMANDPILSQIPDLVNIDLTNTIANVPRAPILEVPTTLPNYINDMKQKLGNHLISGFSNENYYKHLNHNLTDGRMTLANVSPIYGQMFLDSSRTFTFDNNVIRGSVKSVPDAIGNQYMNFHFQDGFTDKNRFKINQLCVQKAQETYPNSQITIAYNAISGVDSEHKSTAGHVGLIIRPNASVSFELSSISESPISGTTVAESFLQDANMSTYSPVIRLLDSMVPQSSKYEQKARNILFADPVDRVIGAFSRIGGVFRNYTTELTNFWTSYQNNTHNNTTLHGKIMGALTNYIENGPGNLSEKRARIRDISQYSGLRLYYEIINSTLDNTNQTDETKKAERAFLFIKRLDTIRNEELSDVDESRHELIKSQMNYLQLLLGLCNSDVNSAITTKIHQKLHISPTGDPRRSYIEYFKHQLKNVIDGTNKPFEVLKLEEQKFSVCTPTAFNKEQTAKVNFDKVQDADDKIVYKIFIKPGTKISGSTLNNLQTLYPNFINSHGVVTRNLVVDGLHIEGLTIEGTFRITRSMNDSTLSYELDGPDGTRSLHVDSGDQDIFIPQYTDEDKPIQLIYLDQHDRTTVGSSGHTQSKSEILNSALTSSANMTGLNVAFVVTKSPLDNSLARSAKDELRIQLNANHITEQSIYLSDSSDPVQQLGFRNYFISSDPSKTVPHMTGKRSMQEFLSSL